MIKNFAGLRQQLEELSTVINSFKSEAVQLRIVELIFKGEMDSGNDDTGSNETAGQEGGRKVSRRSSKKKASAKSGDPASSKKVARGGRKGPATILAELIEEGFFKTKRTINDVIQQASSQKARNFRPNELSSPLARFVRDKRLKRDKNADGQYEYNNQ